MGRNDVVIAARRWIGTPYRHQASCRGGGADCLGLVRGVWREVVGDEPMSVPAYTADWSEPQGEEALWLAAKSCLEDAGCKAMPGDVLLFRMRATGVAKHLGILTATGSGSRFIHAYNGHAVVESPLSAPWSRRIVARFQFPERGQ